MATDRNRKALRLLCGAAGAALASVLVCPAVFAQPAPGGGPPAPAPGSLKVHALTPSISWIEGAGGNVGVIVGDKGVVVVDSTISPSSGREVMDDIAKITPKPVLAVILTHGDVDHVAGLPAFPAGIQIIAQAATKTRLQAALAAGRSNIPADRLPNRTVADRETVDIGGVKLQLLHWSPAHTAGDLVVYAPADKVAFTGDIVATDQRLALIHRETGGSAQGWITTANGVLGLDAGKFVPGHGEVQTKADIRQRRDRVAAELTQIKGLVAKGETLAQVQAEVGDPPPGTTSRFTPFSEAAYMDLTDKKP
jgi:glyoxylase-like metal-dependent hydrolase (beta-lactamase superfamily II)